MKWKIQRPGFWKKRKSSLKDHRLAKDLKETGTNRSDSLWSKYKISIYLYVYFICYFFILLRDENISIYHSLCINTEMFVWK